MKGKVCVKVQTAGMWLVWFVQRTYIKPSLQRLKSFIRACLSLAIKPQKQAISNYHFSKSSEKETYKKHIITVRRPLIIIKLTLCQSLSLQSSLSLLRHTLRSEWIGRREVWTEELRHYKSGIETVFILSLFLFFNQEGGFLSGSIKFNRKMKHVFQWLRFVYLYRLYIFFVE